jgi:single-stranded-DNA-specific exonuclease
MREARTRARWRVKEAPQAGAVAAMLAIEGVGPLEARLLAGRGFGDAGAVGRFLMPSLSDLPDPTSLPGCANAAERLAEAVTAGQPIVIYGDYDVDGVTASAILWHTLRRAGAEVATYIPHRLEEGYGLNASALLSIGQGERTGGVKPLVVTVDCGVTAIEACRAAAAAGVEVIVTDHHRLAASGELPSERVVHPRLHRRDVASGEREGEDDGAWGDLSGAGVAFVLAWQVARTLCGGVDRLPTGWRDLMVDLLGLAALGTVADVVRLIGANRAIVATGLGWLERTGLVGVRALLEATQLTGRAVDTVHVGFVLGPRLNAVGRMGHAGEALELLTSADAGRAAELAGSLSAVNERRRSVEREVLREAEAMIAEQGYASDDRRALVVDGPGWHPGVVGIVASRLVDRYHRPAVVLNRADGVAHGSARSVPGVSIHAGLSACEDLLDRFGGHAMAAGLALPCDRVEQLRERLVSHVNATLLPEELTPTHVADTRVEPGELDLATCERLMRFAPFGRGNPRPVLLAEGVEVMAPPRIVGTRADHLSMRLRHGGPAISAIGMGMADRAGEVEQGSRIDAMVEPKVNVWRGVKSVEMRLIDWRPSARPSDREDAVAAASASAGEAVR